MVDNDVVSVGLEKFRRKVLRSDVFLAVDDESAVVSRGCVVRLERDELGFRDASAWALGFFGRLYHLDLARCEIFDPLLHRNERDAVPCHGAELDEHREGAVPSLLNGVGLAVLAEFQVEVLFLDRLFGLAEHLREEFFLGGHGLGPRVAHKVLDLAAEPWRRKAVQLVVGDGLGESSDLEVDSPFSGVGLELVLRRDGEGSEVLPRGAAQLERRADDVVRINVLVLLHDRLGHGGGEVRVHRCEHEAAALLLVRGHRVLNIDGVPASGSFPGRGLLRYVVDIEPPAVVAVFEVSRFCFEPDARQRFAR